MASCCWCLKALSDLLMDKSLEVAEVISSGCCVSVDLADGDSKAQLEENLFQFKKSFEEYVLIKFIIVSTTISIVFLCLSVCLTDCLSACLFVCLCFSLCHSLDGIKMLGSARVLLCGRVPETLVEHNAGQYC